MNTALIVLCRKILVVPNSGNESIDQLHQHLSVEITSFLSSRGAPDYESIKGRNDLNASLQHELNQWALGLYNSYKKKILGNTDGIPQFEYTEACDVTVKYATAANPELSVFYLNVYTTMITWIDTIGERLLLTTGNRITDLNEGKQVDTFLLTLPENMDIVKFQG